MPPLSRADTARAAIDAVARRDRDALFALLAPDVEWELIGFFLDQERVRRGREDVWEYVRFLDREFESTETELVRLLEVGDGIAAELHVRGKDANSGIEGDLQLVTVYEFDENGLIARSRNYLDMDEALAAGDP